MAKNYNSRRPSKGTKVEETLIVSSLVNDLFIVQAKIGIQAIFRLKGVSTEQVDSLLNSLSDVFKHNKRINKSNLSKNNRIPDIVCDIFGETEAELISIKETMNNIFNDFIVSNNIDKNSNDVELTIAHKLFYDLELTRFYETQPENVYGVGVFFISDTKKKFGKNTLYNGIDTLYIPNPRYIDTSDLKKFKPILDYYAHHNKRTRIELPYPIGVKESNPTKILTRTGKLVSKCALIPFVLKTPYNSNTTDGKTIKVIPSVCSMFNYSLKNDEETGKILNARLRIDYNNQELESSNLLEMLKSISTNWMYKSYLKRQSRTLQTSVVNIYQLSQNLLNYFYFNQYNNKYIKLENIVNLDNKEFNNSIYGPKSALRNRRVNRDVKFEKPNNNNDKKDRKVANGNKNNNSKRSNRNNTRRPQRQQNQNKNNNMSKNTINNNNDLNNSQTPFANLL